MDAATAKLEAKLTQLRVTKDRTKDVVEANNCEKVLRHQQALKALVSEADCFMRDLEGLKIVNKEDLTETAVWNSQVEEEISKADQKLTYIQSWLDDEKRESKKRHREEELEFERELFETRLKFEFELQKAKEQQSQHKVDVQQDTPTTATGLEAKLPKLVITKFNGTYQDWPRFWGQFKETIDKSNVASVTKFAYLRELLDDKVKSTIEALPFTIEGYNRAKSILQGKFGKESEIVKAYTKQILELPTIPDVNVKKIHEFSDKLSYCVQSLETMGKLQQVNGNVAMTLDKLPGIRGDLVRTDPTWQEWDYVKLTDALGLWTRRNPIDESTRKDPPFRHRDRKVFQTKNREVKPRGCVYCDDATHKSSDCPKIVILGDRKQILAQRRLCFNCTREGHRAANCTSKISCQNCDRRHHTSVCDQKEEKKIMTATKSGEGIFPVVTVKVNGITCRALIDSGAGSSYASAKLVNMLHQKPVDVKTKKVEMLMSSRVERLETYETEIESLEGDHNMRVNLIKVNKEELLSVDNPNYTTLIGNYPHLKGVQMNDNDTKSQLPIHVVLGGGEYARVKTESRPRVGREGEPIAELTKLGWFIMSPGQVFDHHRMLMTQTSQTDYEELCRLDVLGLEDAAEHDQGTVYSEFKEQLVRSEEGWYETELPWRGNHPPLPSNKQGSLCRLASLTKKLKREELTEEYRQIIKDQNNQGIVELAPKEPTGQEFYLPHKPVIREDARSTKIRVVYDASARASPTVPSLNECLYSGPPLQNKLWDVLVRQRSFPVVLCGDIQKAFLQIRIKQQQRDALRFHWRSDEHSQVDVYRFTRALFGLTSSPFLLGGVIEQHLETWKNAMPEIVTELQRCMYVDDLLSGGQTGSSPGA